MQGLAAFKKWHHDQLTGVPLDGAEMRVIVFITDLPTIHDILVHLREPTAPPRIASARGDAMGYTGDETRETKLPHR